MSDAKRRIVFLPCTTAVGALLVTVLAGCAGYQIGPQALFRPDVRTISVPVFESDTLRRNLGEWLTEAVIKEIEQTTTYKVVTLTGRIVRNGKHTLTENRRDEPNAIEHSLVVQIQWLNAQGGILIERTFGIPTPLVDITVTSELVPQAGQSIVTAQQHLIQNLASQIVGQLEMPW